MVKAWREQVVIPTYVPGKPEEAPMFLEKRVYQGSSGAVYPYPVIESVADEKTDCEYSAVYLENEYIKVMILPELGGRVQMAYDKIKKRHFVYYNSVVKPALVGLAGPWISGGIEFNWPQHHRPSTYMEVDCDIEQGADGSVTVWVNELERMTHQKGRAGFTLRPGCAYLEIHGIVANPTDLPQTFLWWANPAVAVNDCYRSVFPPDINAVFDHGKRAVSSFPIATGTYYKMDYSAGVDIANYRNIYVPTSYMGVNSRYNFEGGYECDTEAGMLHVANHHVSPGKKQWTWGNGDFGRAWDRNLTDTDGPYIELMAGVYTENQPDFTWLQPFEEKEFTQYFLPYRELGEVKNATRDVLMNIIEEGHGRFELLLFATSAINCVAKVTRRGLGEVVMEEAVSLSPENIGRMKLTAAGATIADLKVEIFSDGKLLLEWEAEPDEIRPVPDPAEAAPLPSEIMTCEQLYLTALHLEQYRHATYSPVDYYEEALRRDPLDVRCNNALGLWYLRRGLFDIAEKHLRVAVTQLKRRNPNPYDGEPLYNLGLALKWQGKIDEAYDMFYKATWNGAWQDAAYLQCSRISAMRGRLDDALYESERSMLRNWHGYNVRSLRTALLYLLSHTDQALTLANDSLAIDRFNYGCLYVKSLITGSQADTGKMVTLMHGNPHNYDEVALDFCAAGLWNLADGVWQLAITQGAVTPMTYYYLGQCLLDSGRQDEATEMIKRASEADSRYCFPNRLEAIAALTTACRLNPADGFAPYALGNLFYDKRQYKQAIEAWGKSASIQPGFPGVWRNLALAQFNKSGNPGEALRLMEKAYNLNPSDSRMLMEFDQLKRTLHLAPQARLATLLEREEIVAQRDDLTIELATLFNLTGQHMKAMETISSRIFHPWEGGEGKVTAQYHHARVELAKKALAEGRNADALTLLEECLVYPENLGEGKLHGAQENDFYYLMGCAYENLGQSDKATEAFARATEGPLDPAPALYYNDAKPDKIFYAGLAWRALGEENKARGYFNRLVNYGRQHLHDTVRIDYFAVSLPDMLIWEGDIQTRNKLHCLYLLALGYLGLADRDRSERYLSEALAIDPYNQGLASLITFSELLPVRRAQ